MTEQRSGTPERSTSKQNAGAYDGVPFEDLEKINKDREGKVLAGDIYGELPPERDITPTSQDTWMTFTDPVTGRPTKTDTHVPTPTSSSDPWVTTFVTDEPRPDDIRVDEPTPEEPGVDFPITPVVECERTLPANGIHCQKCVFHLSQGFVPPVVANLTGPNCECCESTGGGDDPVTGDTGFTGVTNTGDTTFTGETFIRCTQIEGYANSLGIQSGVPGVDGTTMTAADQFCIKCQSGGYAGDPMCDCCQTDYTYTDDNEIVYDPAYGGTPLSLPLSECEEMLESYGGGSLDDECLKCQSYTNELANNNISMDMLPEFYQEFCFNTTCCVTGGGPDGPGGNGIIDPIIPDLIPGCTDQFALNYDPQATTNDGSCEYEEIDNTYGCTDPLAYNYNPLAVIDDGSCEGEMLYGCTDQFALNYDPNANIDDGSCELDIQDNTYGCTDPLAYNYNYLATIDDGSCEGQMLYGCTDQFASNYNPNANINDGSCEYEEITGCQTLPSFNGWAGSGFDNAGEFCGRCTMNNGEYEAETNQSAENFGFPFDCSCCEGGGSPMISGLPPKDDDRKYGCTDPDALNYDPIANYDDGSCEYAIGEPIPGCTDPTAINYNPNATFDDGSCMTIVMMCDMFNNLDPVAQQTVCEGCQPGGMYENNIVCECCESVIPEDPVVRCEMEGDLNGDGQIDELDAGLYMDLATGNISPSSIPCPESYCDFSGVGDDQSNALTVLNWMIGNISELPPCGGISSSGDDPRGSYEQPMGKDTCCKKCKNGKFSDTCCDKEVGEKRCIYRTITDCQLKRKKSRGKCKPRRTKK